MTARRCGSKRAGSPAHGHARHYHHRTNCDEHTRDCHCPADFNEHALERHSDFNVNAGYRSRHANADSHSTYERPSYVDVRASNVDTRHRAADFDAHAGAAPRHANADSHSGPYSRPSHVDAGTTDAATGDLAAFDAHAAGNSDLSAVRPRRIDAADSNADPLWPDRTDPNANAAFAGRESRGPG